MFWKTFECTLHSVLKMMFCYFHCQHCTLLLTLLLPHATEVLSPHILTSLCASKSGLPQQVFHSALTATTTVLGKCQRLFKVFKPGVKGEPPLETLFHNNYQHCYLVGTAPNSSKTDLLFPSHFPVQCRFNVLHYHSAERFTLLRSMIPWQFF